jgi:acyl-CoA synthetase (AMP-forming)/AMP-acid ligase II
MVALATGDFDESPEASPEFRTLVDVLRWRATRQQGRLAYRFLPHGEVPEASLTYGDLDRRARAIGAALQSLEGDGERALLVYPPGLDFICAYFGCLYAGVIPIAAQPPHPVRMRRFRSRISGIVNDAKPSLALTTLRILEVLGR